MSIKKEKRSAIWEMLFSFLVISKVLYYSDFITASLNQGGLWAMGETLLNRMLTQDILIILIILLTFNTERLVTMILSKYNKIVNQMMVHIIDYVLYMGVLATYFGLMLFFGIFENFSWLVFLIYSSIIYLVIIIAIEAKKYLKKKEMTAYTHALSTDEKLAMLKTLLDNSVLTQEEYDRKKEELLGV
ncbi:MAG: SHOCT domain-containing protein [Defluviitaleaceae bacterium]|nr:SHOCT domain-containing protein [Defluviitaleaceae bacterium]